jgi:hypothetical protein
MNMSIETLETGQQSAQLKPKSCMTHHLDPVRIPTVYSYPHEM